MVHFRTFAVYLYNKIMLNMDHKLTKKEIGERLAELRNAKDISQEELAKSVEISRSSITKIESGKRGVDVLELKKISLKLGFSIDEFTGNDFNPARNIALINRPKSDDSSERISVPSLDVEKFKNVLLYVLEKCAGKPNVGETVLNKLLYFSDFNYYELYEEHLTGVVYKKLPYGPVPQNLDLIINKMIEDKELQRIKTEYHHYPQTRYLPLIKPDLKSLKASEKDTIDRVIEQMSDWSASSLSNYSHRDMPWLASKDGEDINYELAFYRDAPFSVRNYGDENEE